MRRQRLPHVLESNLAFVDVETTGLRPSEDRVAEIGVVTVDADRVERWTTLIKPTRRRELDSATDSQPVDRHDDAPSFAEIATDLARRLSGRLFIAHNARFDHSFLRAEFHRVGIAFQPQVVCSVMLSRRLHPHLPHHNLDALADCHRLVVEERHRALPDAELVWQWWQVIQRQIPRKILNRAIASLLAAPMLPSQLDSTLIDRLPQTPGAYVFYGEHHHPLIVGAASNLKLHVLNYFRLDHATARALEYAHRITHITWRATRGILGARLHAAELDALFFANADRRLTVPAFTWRLAPDAVPCLELMRLADVSHQETELYGLYTTERKARNALDRLAGRHRLCDCLLGTRIDADVDCQSCAVDQSGHCDKSIRRKKELVRIFDELRPLRVSAWPHRGPVGIRERSDLHVVDRWRFLGTARSVSEVHGLLESRPREFDPRVYRLLHRTMSVLPQHRIVDLSRHARSPASASSFTAEVPS
jgi:DNA polymerase-3 subunit epsilon